MLKTYTYPSPSKAIHPLKSDLSNQAKVNITNKSTLDSNLSDKTKIDIANKTMSKKSCSKIKDNELIKRNNSKTTESKRSKNLKQREVPQQKLVTPKTTKAAKSLQKVAQSRMIMLKAVRQAI